MAFSFCAHSFIVRQSGTTHFQLLSAQGHVVSYGDTALEAVFSHYWNSAALRELIPKILMPCFIYRARRHENGRYLTLGDYDIGFSDKP
jgi:hypothetical protein